MTRKDYIKLADALKIARETAMDCGSEEMAIEQTHGVKLATSAIMATLAHDNPNFDRAKFTKAVGF